MIGQQLKMLRELNNLTQRQVAEILNIDRSTYSYYELGKTRPDIYMITKLARVYNVSTDYLLEFDQKTNSVLHDDSIEYKHSYPNIRYLSELRLEEQQLVLYFRQLKDEDKEKVLEEVKKAYETELDENISKLPKE